MRIRILGAVFLACGFIAFRLYADELLLKNGNVIVGKIVQETADSITIKVLTESSQGKAEDERFIQMSFQKKDIRRITRDANFFQPVNRSGGAKQEQEDQAPASNDITPAMETEKPKSPKSAGDDSAATKGKTK